MPARSTPPRALILIALLTALSLAPRWARAAQGKVVVLNCSGAKVHICAFDKTDVVLKYAASSGDLEAGGVVTMTCNSSGGCKLKVDKPGTSCSTVNDETSFAGATSLGEYAYRFRKDSGSRYTFDKLSEDRGFFDNNQHRSCTATQRFGEACKPGLDCIEGYCNTSTKGGSVCCKANCGTATCQSCSAAGDACVATAYGQSGQYCEQSWQMCDGARCVWRASVANGKACVGPLECKSGFCADGVCCSAACDGACLSCNQAGKAGTCAPVARGQSDPGTCDAICDGAGKCQKKNGALCVNDGDCASGHCQSLTVGRGTGQGPRVCR